MSEQEPEQAACGVTHYAGCACHEKGWEKRWKMAIDMAARAGIERDDAREKARRLAVFAGEILAEVHINASYGVFCQATEEQIESWVKERAERLASISQSG